MKMKKLILGLCVGLAGLNASAADKGDVAVGLALPLFPSPGLMAKGQYNFTRVIRGEAMLHYAFDSKVLGIIPTPQWVAGLNAHCLIRLTQKFRLYPIAGAHFAHIPDDKDKDKDLFGGTVGLGAELSFSRHWGINFDFLCYLNDDGAIPVPALGVAYTF